MPARAWKISGLRLPRFGFRPLSILLGILLLATAGLKAHGLTIDPLAQDSFLAPPRLLVATIEIEIILGVWLLSGWWRRPAWKFLLAFFAIMTAVSFYLALAGQTSCGCFGRITVNPWLILAIDVAVLGTLLLCRPPRPVEMVSRSSIPVIIKVGGGSAGFLALFTGIFLFAFDSPLEALARLRGESVTVNPSVANLGDGARREAKEFSVELTNRTKEVIQILGGTSNCGCFTTTNLPITLNPGESRAITVGVRFQGSRGNFLHHFVLYTDDERQPFVIARFSGRVVVPID